MKKNAIEVRENVYWVGSLDYDIRVFDIIMHTKYGTTYNAYVIKGQDKVALIETAKDSFFDEYLERLKDVIDPAKIDYVICNHTEPDHSGSLDRLFELNPNIEVIASQQGAKYILDITNKPLNTKVVKDGDFLDLGGKRLRFMMAPFLHWPDSMWTYMEEDRILFTCDAFGCHYCSEDIFNDTQKKADDFLDAYKYYFDVIMGPFKGFVLTALNKLEGLPVAMICTGHGPILRADISKYIDLYRQWAEVKKPEKTKIVIAFCSAYGYTRKLAEKIDQGVQAAGASTVVFDLVDANTDAILHEIDDAAGVLIGSPTLVGDTLPPVWALLSHINPYIHKSKIMGVFGSYGWSGEAVPNIEARINQLRLKMPVESLKVLFKPSDEDLDKAFDMGKKFAEEAKIIIGKA